MSSTALLQNLVWQMLYIGSEADLVGLRASRAPFFCNHLFFRDHFEELHIAFIEVKLIVNNSPLT